MGLVQWAAIPMSDAPIAGDEVLRELERILASRAFQGAGRSGAILRFLLERTLAGQADQLKEYTVGAEALGRGESFDPRTDAIVRVEISRLRSRLSHYYATEGSANPVRIVVPEGFLRSRLRERSPKPRESAGPEAASRARGGRPCGGRGRGSGVLVSLA